MNKMLCLSAVFGLSLNAFGQLVISGNENKIDLTSGTPSVVTNAEDDSITLIDFSDFPPKVEHLYGIPNSVIGPPSNIAIAPNGELALIANSLRIDPADPTKYVPENHVHVLDLKSNPPRVKQVETDAQPSGISISADGSFALVANRAAGTISVLHIDGKNVSHAQTLAVCLSEDNVSDVAIHPNGKLALASVQQAGYLAVLAIQDRMIQLTPRKISVYGKPYRVVITPDGEVGLTAGQGYGSAVDTDALTVIDLESDPIRSVDFVPLGAVPESFEVSPNGKLIAAVMMSGSNLPADNPHHTDAGSVVLLSRKGTHVEVEQTVPVGPIPEGVAFTSDGDYLLVQSHPARAIWVFEVGRRRLKDTGLRIEVPGMPSSLRAAP
ncbi:beta-propeller fold lactonase family protein [Verrucomicrobia bacterium]|jgi:DNA-binding beta-propeller fold protein YncE|nr:beta-propeller fold lactonase family protein [Pseudomonadota bacterium]MBT5706658.1 beta-propeller fold lactonase family protein [Verrucomicrobiota bacterium]MDA7657290.1 beta-propeller fold lactonase family protein [Verrucomicrobiota bacterium]MDB4746496.1 beta-propeller fold lactonase family protein [Verrucomicrobiota bacterium]